MRGKPRLIEFKGREYKVKDLGERFGIKPSIIIFRVDHGWSVEDALTTPVRNYSNGSNSCKATHWQECFSCKFEDCVRSVHRPLKGEFRNENNPKNVW